jgi:hypothetical protein
MASTLHLFHSLTNTIFCQNPEGKTVLQAPFSSQIRADEGKREMHAELTIFIDKPFSIN